jgi:hypothetical protein
MFGDSMFVEQVMKGTHVLSYYTLLPFLEEIKILSTYFTHISFTHVYKTHNQKVN